jgi:nitrite reductase (NO-forming)
MFIRSLYPALVFTALNLGCATTAQNQSESEVRPDGLPRIVQQPIAPPFMPPHDQVATGGPKIIEVQLVAKEEVMNIGDGVNVHALTYNGMLPGPAIVAHEGDYVEVTLENPAANLLRHTIDLHAATGALGGAGLMKVEPGERASIRFKAIKPGVFVYHCAPGGPQIPYHVVSGMNGVIMILPRDGLKDQNGGPVRYDRVYYIGEQDFYLSKGSGDSYKTFGSPLEAMPETLKAMRSLTPSHVVFNGAAGALTGKNALTAKVGENVLFIHSQANRDSRPHLIGGHADLVWQGGSFSSDPLTDLETWFVPGGSAVAALYEFRQPGTYVYLNHNLIEAVLLGAAAHIQVDGEWNDDLMKQLEEAHAISP